MYACFEISLPIKERGFNYMYVWRYLNQLQKRN